MEIRNTENNFRNIDEPESKFWKENREKIYARFSRLSKQSMVDGDLYSVFFEEIAILVDIIEEKFHKKLHYMFYACIVSSILSSIAILLWIFTYLFHL